MSIMLDGLDGRISQVTNVLRPVACYLGNSLGGVGPSDMIDIAAESRQQLKFLCIM